MSQPGTQVGHQVAGASGPSPSTDASDPLQPAPLPKGQPTLIGGTVSKVDKIQEAVVVRPYGGGKIKVFFDDRTHIFRDGVETTMLGIHPRDRVYVDTLQDGSRVFAKNIRVETLSPPADASGQIVRYSAHDARLEILDPLSSQPISFRVTEKTVVRLRGEAGSLNDLAPGSLIKVRFSAEAPGQGLAREVDILASPGSSFVFQGKITYLDLSRGVLALQNRTDAQNYEIHFDPAAGSSLAIGRDVSVNAVFDGNGYTASEISLLQESKQEAK